MASPYPLHTILFLDIETVSQYSAFGELPPEWQELWRHKAEALLRDKLPATPEEIYGRSAIYAEFGKVVCISCGVLSGPPAGRKLSIKSFYGDDEKDLLTRFCDLLNKLGIGGTKIPLRPQRKGIRLSLSLPAHGHPQYEAAFRPEPLG
ncbi:hypothetical protein ACQ86N_44485 [Puia sp. P3]|uniref:hypothetical protein n=1 Tax=Puia sp. P3 TaxID=3423952 RepID=UPI003D67AB33